MLQLASFCHTPQRWILRDSNAIYNNYSYNHPNLNHMSIIIYDTQLNMNPYC